MPRLGAAVREHAVVDDRGRQCACRQQRGTHDESVDHDDAPLVRRLQHGAAQHRDLVATERLQCLQRRAHATMPLQAAPQHGTLAHDTRVVQAGAAAHGLLQWHTGQMRE